MLVGIIIWRIAYKNVTVKNKLLTIIMFNFVSSSGASCLCHALRQFVHLAVHWFVTSIIYNTNYNNLMTHVISLCTLRANQSFSKRTSFIHFKHISQNSSK